MDFTPVAGPKPISADDAQSPPNQPCTAFTNVVTCSGPPLRRRPTGFVPAKSPSGPSPDLCTTFTNVVTFSASPARRRPTGFVPAKSTIRPVPHSARRSQMSSPLPASSGGAAAQTPGRQSPTRSERSEPPGLASFPQNRKGGPSPHSAAHLRMSSPFRPSQAAKPPKSPAPGPRPPTPRRAKRAAQPPWYTSP